MLRLKLQNIFSGTGEDRVQEAQVVHGGIIAEAVLVTDREEEIPEEADPEVEAVIPEGEGADRDPERIGIADDLEREVEIEDAPEPEVGNAGGLLQPGEDLERKALPAAAVHLTAAMTPNLVLQDQRSK